ncbi:DUF6343 family protein [Marinactinospora rubrisoli]|uniref:DUF6343 family protein n=1 Tax=Marinactinospora rubrisoli TaxID=2715399 RepID=A0ABW2KKH7_9ACTN
MGPRPHPNERCPAGAASLRFAITTPGIIAFAGLGIIALVTGQTALAAVLGVLTLVGAFDFVALVRRTRRGPVWD